MCHDEWLDVLEKFSKAMLKRNKGTAGISNPSNSKTIVRDYLKTKNIYTKNIRNNLNAYITGSIDHAKFLSLQRSEISKAFEQAFLKGKLFGGGGFDLSPDEKKFLSYQVAKEMGFMTGFANDVRNGSGRMPYGRRISMYSDSLDAMFGFGRLVYLPDDVKIYWRLGATDKHCLDCLAFAANNPYTKRTLPGYPKSGNSECLSNCKCSLSYIFRNTFNTNDYHSFILSGKNYDPKRNIPSEEDYMELMNLREEFFYNRQMFDLTKDPVYKKEYMRLQKQFNTYKTSNNLYFPVFFHTRRNLVDLKSFNRNVKFSLIKTSSEVKKGDLISLFIADTTQYVKVKEVSGTDIIVKTLEGIEIYVNPTKNVIFKEI